MMTREEILSIEEYCVEHNVSHKDRLEELGMFSWSYYAAKQCHIERSETSFPRLLSQVYCVLFYFCHVERSETSLTGFPVTVRNPDHGRPVNPLKIPLKRYSFTY